MKKKSKNPIKRAMDRKKERKSFARRDERYNKKCQISPYVFQASQMK